MMRITPLVVFLSHLKDETLIKRAVYAEQGLTHSNTSPIEASYVYALICGKLI